MPPGWTPLLYALQRGLFCSISYEMLKWLVEGAAPRSRRQEADSLEGESLVGGANLFSLTSELSQPPTYRPKPTRLPLFGRSLSKW